MIGPQTWRQVRRTAQDTLHTPVLLAGGALRDVDHGLLDKVKDLDLFVPAEDAYAFDCVVDRLKRVWGEPHEAFNIDETYRQWSYMVTGVASWKLLNVPEVQVIGMDLLGAEWSTETVLKTFDFGLGQIGYDGERLVRTRRYLADQKDKTITLLNVDTAMGLARSFKRHVRLLEKYPEHVIRVDEQLVYDRVNANENPKDDSGKSLLPFADV